MIEYLTKLLKGWGISLPHSTVSEAELRALIDNAATQGVLVESQREMIQSVLDLGETLVRELMVPRIDIVWMEGNKTLRQGLSLALR